VLLFGVAATVVTGLAFGLVPALRLSAAEEIDAFRDGRGTADVRVRRGRALLVLAECSLAIVLLAGAGLLLRSLAHLRAVEPGFDATNVLAVRLEFPVEPPPAAEERLQTSRVASARAAAQLFAVTRLLDGLRTMPGVVSAGFIDDMFITGQGHQSITIPGRASEGAAGGELAEGAVTPGFFEALRVPLRRGRRLGPDDAARKIQALWSPITTDLSLAEKERRAVAEPVVVNEAFVRHFFPGADPIGRKFCMDPENKTYWYEIVGVAGDMHRQGLEHDAIPEYMGSYIPSSNGRADLMVRVRAEPVALISTLRREIQRLLPGVTIVSATTAESQFGSFSAQRRLETWLLTGFAALGLLLAAIGIFGLVHYAVAERTREIGVRVALGATPGEVVRMVVLQGMRMPAFGVAVGVAAAVGLTRLMSHLLFGVSATDPLTFGSVALLLLGVSLAACYMAGRRAAAVDPVIALRQG